MLFYEMKRISEGEEEDDGDKIDRVYSSNQKKQEKKKLLKTKTNESESESLPFFFFFCSKSPNEEAVVNE